MATTVVDNFEIPEQLAHRLSNLLVIQGIRMQLLENLIDNPPKYEKAEKLLLPIAQEIDTIKYKITTEHVPEKYRSEDYAWNYEGWDLSRNVVQIMKTE